MLTSDLVRARVVKGEVLPGFVSADAPRTLEYAESLVALFREAEGGSQGALDEALGDALSEGGGLKIRRGLAKLLRNRCTFSPEVEVDPVALRREVFLVAGTRHPVGAGRVPDDREAVLREVAGRLDLTEEQVDKGLFADLKDAHRLVRFDAIEPRDLIQRYNVALAQGVLFRATKLRITIADNPPARYRQLFRWIKFYQLSFTAEPLPAGGYVVELDGPLSLFRLINRYGLNLARFLPALLLARGWRLEAELSWPRVRGRARFSLDEDAGLVSHYRDTGAWTPEEEGWFVDRFAALDTPWRLVREERILSLGGRDVLVPDFVLRHEDGREAYLEIVWAWRKGGLARHLEQIERHAPPNLILAMSDRYRLSEEAMDELPDGVVRFKQVLPPKRVLKVAERVAVRP